VGAEVTDSDLEALTARLDQLETTATARLDDLAGEIAELAVTVWGGQNLGALNELEGMAQRLALLEDQIEETHRDLVTTADNIDDRPIETAVQGVTDLSHSLRG
jgi:uncharacterized protein YukE